MIQVAVIGAGPAGSTAAEVLASSGVEVALIDRKNEIGSPVECGGFLPAVHELKDLMPGAVLPDALVNIPERCILHRTKLQRLYGPSGKPKEFAVDGRVIDRRAYDRYLAYRAARAGATIFPGTRAELNSGEVGLSGHFPSKIKPAVVVGADGPNSGVGRSIGRRAGEMGVCLVYEMADVDIDDDAVEMYFGTRYAPGGYAWIIPQGQDVANVGIGVRVSFMGKQKLPQVLERFIKEHPVAGRMLGDGEVLAVMGGIVPAEGMRGDIQKDNVLLAGDAAGHVMATSGGGIPLAMVAGRIAGEVAAGFLRGQTSLKEYQSRVMSEFGKELERSVQIRRIVDLAMHSDRAMDALFGVLDADDIKSVMRGQIPDALHMVQQLASTGKS
ncbi:MAG: geranylgeranyl reductase family protein [Methanotrichaceae archaeon]